MNSKTTIIKFVILYFIVRLFSYFFSPVTPLIAQHPINTIISVLIFILSTYWIIKKDERGWYIIAGEIIFGGSGGYLKLDFISLRSALLFSSTIIFFIQKIYLEKNNFFKQFDLKNYLIFTLIGAAGVAALRGLYIGHASLAIFSDFIPYLFLLYYFPLRELWLSDRFRMLGTQAIIATIFGNTLMILLTQIGLSSGLIVLQDSYYHWYRDVALGKITELNFHFYRLVLNEHLLLIPITIYFIGNTIKNKITKQNILVLSSLLFLLASNLTRAYMLALAIGILFLFSKIQWKKWLTVSCAVVIGFVLIFVTTHTIASRSKSLGLEIFGVRLQSIVSPQIEESSLSRLLLLPKIMEKINLHPILGSGLGDTVTVYSPIFKTDITTPHFDWGYHEINVETGVVGTLSWIGMILFTFYYINKTKDGYNKNIFRAILITILVINITSPALFHVFGILLLIFILSPTGIIYRHSAGGIVIDKIGRIILVSNKDPNWWTPPKGGIEIGEDDLTAARREIFEETGLTKIEYIKDLGSINRVLWHNGVFNFKKITLFLFKTEETKLKPEDLDNRQAKWFTYEESLEIIKSKEIKDFLIEKKHDLI